MIRDNPDPERFKWCTIGQHFELKTNFYKNRSRADGLSNYCVGCNSKRSFVYHREVRRGQRFGITAEEYERMYDEQEGRCAVCKEEPESTLCVDHDHETGEVRRLLCQNCNKALGLLKEHPETLKNMIAYLKEFGSRRHPNQSNT